MIDRRTSTLLRCLLAGFALSAQAAEPLPPVEHVVPVDWTRFDQPARDDDLDRATRMLLNAARYNLAWAPGAADRIERDGRQLEGVEPHNVIRPACEAAYALAVVLRTDIFDEQAVGLPLPEARRRALRLIRATAAVHDRASWNYPWQSSFWAALLGNAAWLLWDDLDADTRRQVAEIVEFEADRFLAPGYRVPYWNGRGGDTKAEENAWDSMIHHVAVAMMPGHPHVPRWKQVGGKLMASAYAMKADMEDDTVVDGKPVLKWLDGYNVRDDGVLVNHGFFHPDYMTCVKLKLRAVLTQSLVGGPVPETAEFGAERVYRVFTGRRWPSPPYEPPGGTIYVPGRAEVYYPKGTDWFAGRVVIYHLLDVYADVLGWKADAEHTPAYWARLRADRILQRQREHADRAVYGPGEFTRHVPREQDAAWGLADAFLLQWLRARRALSRRGNWLAESSPSAPASTAAGKRAAMVLVPRSEFCDSRGSRTCTALVAFPSHCAGDAPFGPSAGRWCYNIN